MDTHWPFTGFRWTLKLGDSSLERARDTQRYAGMLIRLLASSSLLVQLEKVHEVWDLEKTGILQGPSLNDSTAVLVCMRVLLHDVLVLL